MDKYKAVKIEFWKGFIIGFVVAFAIFLSLI